MDERYDDPPAGWAAPDPAHAAYQAPLVPRPQRPLGTARPRTGGIVPAALSLAVGGLLVAGALGIRARTGRAPASAAPPPASPTAATSGAPAASTPRASPSASPTATRDPRHRGFSKIRPKPKQLLLSASDPDRTLGIQAADTFFDFVDVPRGWAARAPDAPVPTDPVPFEVVAVIRRPGARHLDSRMDIALGRPREHTIEARLEATMQAWTRDVPTFKVRGRLVSRMVRLRERVHQDFEVMVDGELLYGRMVVIGSGNAYFELSLTATPEEFIRDLDAFSELADSVRSVR